MAKNDPNGMIQENRISTIPLGVAFWLGVSRDHVVQITKYHGLRIFLGLGLLEEPKMALIWAYKGSGLNIAQMGLLPKDEMQEISKYAFPEFIRIIGGSQLG